MAEVRELIRRLAGDNRTVILSQPSAERGGRRSATAWPSCPMVSLIDPVAMSTSGAGRRGKPQVRLRTTDDRKAREMLNSLAWVDGVNSDGVHLVAAVDAARSWEINRLSLSSQRSLRVRHSPDGWNNTSLM